MPAIRVMACELPRECLRQLPHSSSCSLFASTLLHALHYEEANIKANEHSGLWNLLNEVIFFHFERKLKKRKRWSTTFYLFTTGKLTVNNYVNLTIAYYN